MPLPTVSFLLGVVVVAYLFTFVIFALLRIVTGVSIQRVGYSGLRRIAFSVRHGIKINIRGIGISLHRPTFALPTWCSVIITELTVAVDLQALREGNDRSHHVFHDSNGTPQGKGVKGTRTAGETEQDEGRGKLWRTLTSLKEKVKKLHRLIHWIKLVDLIAVESTLNIVGVGSVQLELVTLSVDTRAQTVDRSRLFQHHKHDSDTQTPAEWRSVFRSVLFTPEGREATEILDYCSLNVHGMLHREREGLRDASIAWKLGRLTIPYDDIEYVRQCADLLRGRYAHPHSNRNSADISFSDVVDELEKPGSRGERIVQTVSDSRAFIASILRGIHEVQFAVGFLGLSRKLAIKGHADQDVYLNFAMKEVGLDILRLDQKSPAHRMYFSPKDVAHQGLLTGIAISAGIDDGHEHPERMLYIPMITATVKTTLPSRTIHYVKADEATDRNSNILYATFVCTSPSVDLDPKHLPLIRELSKQQSGHRPKTSSTDRHQLISQLLPKAHVKLSIQEPVLRISLPPIDKKNAAVDDFDLIISTCSTIAFECESSHASSDQSHYSLESYYRHSRHRFYYQTAAGERHDLLQSDFVEVKVDVNALPEVSVTAHGQAQTFTMFLVRPEISKGVRQIMKQMRRNVLAQNRGTTKPQASFLRTMPSWLHSFHFEGSSFGLELAGVDEQVSTDTRGFALQLESWSTEYKAHRADEPVEGGSTRRKSVTKSSSNKDKHARNRSSSPLRRVSNIADGRRLTLHLQNLEGLIVDSLDDSDYESFLTLPRFEVAFSTSTDAHGPIFHINSFAKSIMLKYSLYNHFAMGVAMKVIKKTFLERPEERSESRPQHMRHISLTVPGSDPSLEEIAAQEITAVDFRTALVQIKAQMPQDPPMMLQVFHLECGQHRWSTPFFRNRLTRLYVRAPATKKAWSRIVSIKVLRLDLRETRRKVGKQQMNEKSIDVVAETIRFAIPNSLVVHSIFDNITNVVKTSQQLQHHFATGSNEYILVKEPEGPKHVPKITIRTQLLLFDIEDNNFEWKLGSIYRAGLVEQKQRLAREDAFNLKEKKLGRARRSSSRFRAQSAHPEDRARTSHRRANAVPRRSHSLHDGQTSPQHSQRHARRRMRYDADGKCGISGDASQVTIEQARERLHHLNSQSWKTRIDGILQFQHRAMRDMRTMIWGMDNIPEDVEQHEPILAITQRPGLMVIAMNDLAITIDKPSFPINDYPKFLHDVGKGMPTEMKYGLLVPMNLHVTMGETRVHLRDYPLPLLHVPPLNSGQSPRLPSLSMRTDFVIAEEFRDLESQRHVNVQVIPPAKMSNGSETGFSIEVRRTISAVKTYSDIKFEINTSNPTRLTWSTSYQPAIQDAMQVIESFTKPPVDPSDRVGFWDKIRLSFHSRVNVAWKGDGDVNLTLKGSRDPYVVTGDGAGLVMVWRNNVNWQIAQDEDPRKFMIVDSGEYILAVPDFNHYARRSQEWFEADDGASSASSISKRDATFKKVVMKLSGRVRWLAGLMFERDLSNGERSFNFKPHYDVVLKHPDFAKAPDGEVYDAYRGFRSQHIHMSIAVSAPHDRNWSVSNLKPSSNYNSIHLTPRFFSHFFSWWSMFSGVMSLPVRQGPLWGVTEKKSKKFGRHIATIKYNILLSPLFISHVYKHKDAEDYQANVVSATGLKMRLDSFMLDLHQRREHFDLKGREGARSKKTSAMRINQAQLDFISADLRALSASIEGTSVDEINKANDEMLASLQGALPSVDMSKFEIPDNDFTWIDMDDFVELDWILPAEADPHTRILPVGYAPRFSYFRQTDHDGTIAGDATRTSPFGDEPTHYCVMSAKNDPRRVQAELIGRRLDLLKEKQEQNVRALGDHELKIIRQPSGDRAGRQALDAKMESLREHSDYLQTKHDFMQSMLDTLIQRLERDDPVAVPDLETSETFFDAHENAKTPDLEMVDMDTAPLADYTSDFNNRFIVHNAQIKWNNSLRNIILRYIHQNSQRRGFVYYMSRRAVKFILDVLEERESAKNQADQAHGKSSSTQNNPASPDGDDDAIIQERIEQLLRDGRSFVNADEPNDGRQGNDDDDKGPSDEIGVEFAALNTYHFRLIAPQIQLQSEKNSKSVVLVTAKGMQLKVVQIMEKDKIDDDVSGLVQRRFNAAADSLQMFVTSSKTFSTEYLHFYSANRYGTNAGTYWPPWIPMEIMFEYESNPYGFNRVVHRTSASMRYDKHNTLRLKYNDHISGGDQKASERAEESEDRLDHVWLEFPHFKAICDSRQYFAMYIIVVDLLLYSEPLEKTRSERLEKIMLASDFSDLTGAPEMVQMLQERIRQLEEIKLHFQVNEKFLDREGWKDRITIDQDLASCEDELFFMMKAITTSQQRIEDRREQENTTGLVHMHIASKEIGWHLIHGKGESLMEVQLKNASFDRTDNNDGSNYNVMEIGRINGFNLLPDALYPEIIGPFDDETRGGRLLGHSKMLRIHWLMLEAIAGIPVVDYFEVDLVPLKLQVEREVAKKLFEYIFPGVGGNAFDGGGFSPFMVKSMLPAQDEKDDEETDSILEPGIRTDSPDIDRHSLDASGPGSLEARLRPTLNLPASPKKAKMETRGLGISHAGHLHGLAIFQHSDKARGATRSAASRQALSQANLSPMTRSPSDRSLATMRSDAGSADQHEKANKRFQPHRTNSDEKKRKKEKGKDGPSDDLTQMMSRASNYMTLAFVKIPSMVLCLSYKGQGKRNIEDVHDLVFRLPTLEYRNKTWSNLDLALQLKKDVIRALISHTGAIIGNKLSHHRPTRQQQSRLRELANRSTFMSPNPSNAGVQEPPDWTTNSSETSSLVDHRSSEHGGRSSSARPPSSNLRRSISYGSTPSVSTSDLRFSMDQSSYGDMTNGHNDTRDIPRSSPQAGNADNGRPQSTSLARHLTGFGERLRARGSSISTTVESSSHAEENDDTRRKNKLLLGGQKLLGRLRD